MFFIQNIVKLYLYTHVFSTKKYGFHCVQCFSMHGSSCSLRFKRLFHSILVRYAKNIYSSNRKNFHVTLVQLTLVACILTKPKFKINEIFQCRNHDEKYNKIEFLLCVVLFNQTNYDIFWITFHIHWVFPPTYVYDVLQLSFI